jgi:hypothetical protein
VELFLGVGVVIIGVAYTSYRTGLQRGAEWTLQSLYDRKIIIFDRWGNPEPNLYQINKDTFREMPPD